MLLAVGDRLRGANSAGPGGDSPLSARTITMFEEPRSSTPSRRCCLVRGSSWSRRANPVHGRWRWCSLSSPPPGSGLLLRRPEFLRRSRWVVGLTSARIAKGRISPGRLKFPISGPYQWDRYPQLPILDPVDFHTNCSEDLGANKIPWAVKHTKVFNSGFWPG